MDLELSANFEFSSLVGILFFIVYLSHFSVIASFHWNLIDQVITAWMKSINNMYPALPILQDGHPPLGWYDTAAYLVLPVLLVVSQFVSMEIMKPPQVSFHEVWICSFFRCLLLSMFWYLIPVFIDRWSGSEEHTSCI